MLICVKGYGSWFFEKLFDKEESLYVTQQAVSLCVQETDCFSNKFGNCCNFQVQIILPVTVFQFSQKAAIHLVNYLCENLSMCWSLYFYLNMM